MPRQLDRPRRTPAELFAFAPQVIGAFGFMFSILFWAATFIATGKGALEPIFVTTSGGLLAVGLTAEAVASLRSSPPVPPPLPDPAGPDAPSS